MHYRWETTLPWPPPEFSPKNSRAAADVSSAPFFSAFRITLTLYLDGYVRDALQAKYPSIAIHFGRRPQRLLKVV